MQNYTEFTAKGQTFKAFHTLENLYRIEAQGLNLADLAIAFSEGKSLSFTESKKLLEAALWADIKDTAQRIAFVNDFLNEKRFKGTQEIVVFVMSAMTAPNSQDNSEQAEKKTTASE